MSPSIHELVLSVRRRCGAYRVLRGVATGLGLSAIALALDAGVWWSVLAGAGALVGWLTRPDAAATARRMDVAATLLGEVECAWDHRQDSTPMLLAQRARAVTRYLARRPARVVPRPHALWLVPALGWGVAMAGSVSATSPDALQATHEAATTEATDTGSDAVKVGPQGIASKPRAARAATSASEEAAGAEPGAQATPGGRGQGGAPTARGGVGARAGATGAGARGDTRTALRSGAGAALTLARGAGTGAANGGSARAARAVTAAQLDAVADPARPYPGRHRHLIRAWFDREIQR